MHLNDPSYGQQWYLPAIKIDAAQGLIANQNVVAAVIDTGVNYNHPDLTGRVQAGYDFVNNDNDADDDDGHGSHVAGVIAATQNNGVGIAGITGSNIMIMPLKSLDENGSGYLSDIANAIYYAADNGAHVINISAAGSGKSNTIEAALKYAANKNVLVFSAAGNDGEKLTGSRWVSPASYARDIGGFIAVAALNQNFKLASFSNFSSNYVELSAPGTSILSLGLDDDYYSASGTSVSSPMAAGVASLLVGHYLSNGTSYTAAELEQILLNGSRKISGLTDDVVNGKVVDIKALVASLNQPPQTPQVSKYITSIKLIDKSTGTVVGDINKGSRVEVEDGVDYDILINAKGRVNRLKYVLKYTVNNIEKKKKGKIGSLPFKMSKKVGLGWINATNVDAAGGALNVVFKLNPYDGGKKLKNVKVKFQFVAKAP